MDCPVQNLRIAILGCGFMGSAILKGLLDKIPRHSQPTLQITPCVRSVDSGERVKQSYSSDDDRVCLMEGRHLYALAGHHADIVILGVPPAELRPLLKLNSKDEGGSLNVAEELLGKTVISLLAGISCDEITEILSTATAKDESQFNVIRTIPSIAATHQDSVTLLADTTHAGSQNKDITKWLFQQIGTVHLLPERLMNEATAMHATCNALTMVGVEAVTDASVAEGLPRQLALSLAANSLRSAAGLLEKHMTPESMKESMSIPNGITINALLELERKQVRSGISDTTRHAIDYTRKMA